MTSHFETDKFELTVRNNRFAAMMEWAIIAANEIKFGDEIKYIEDFEHNSINIWCPTNGVNFSEDLSKKEAAFWSMSFWIAAIRIHQKKICPGDIAVGSRVDHIVNMRKVSDMLFKLAGDEVDKKRWSNFDEEFYSI